MYMQIKEIHEYKMYTICTESIYLILNELTFVYIFMLGPITIVHNILTLLLKYIVDMINISPYLP